VGEWGSMGYLGLCIHIFYMYTFSLCILVYCLLLLDSQVLFMVSWGICCVGKRDFLWGLERDPSFPFSFHENISSLIRTLWLGLNKLPGISSSFLNPPLPC